jgi:hypothetical protein
MRWLRTMRLEQGIAKVFTLDTKTNQMAVMPLDPSMFPALINIYVIGALIPLVFFFYLNQHLCHWRHYSFYLFVYLFVLINVYFACDLILLVLGLFL